MIKLFVGDDKAPSLALPLAALLAAVVAGIGLMAYTLTRYDAMPDPVPTHFGLTGQPDGWSPKSVGSVMALPLMTLVMGSTLGGVAILIGRAKLRLRRDSGSSLTAQNRYRSAVSRYLAVLGLLVTTMFASAAVTSAQVALGERRTLPALILLVGLAIFLYALGGAAWLALRYGRGGSAPRSST